MRFIHNILRLLFSCVLLMGIMTFQACSGDSEGGDQPGEGQMKIGFGNMTQAAQGQFIKAPQERNLEDILKELYPGETPNFRVWAFKTMDYNAGTGIYGNPKTVMDRFIVEWHENTAGTTLSNTADWEYVGVSNSYLGTDGGGAAYTQDIRYWDTKATSYRFFGFAPSEALEHETNYTYPADHGDGYTWFDITFPADASHPEQAPYMSKMWFSNNDPVAYPNHRYGQTVKMQFIKPITKVRIEVVKADGTLIEDPSAEGFTSLNFQPASGDVKIVQEGTLKVSYAITGTATIAYYTPTVAILGDPTGSIRMNKIDDTYNKWYYVLPHVTQGDFQLVANIGGESKVAQVPAEYMSWNPNMEYTYRFRLTDTNFQFIDVVQIAVTEWQTIDNVHNIHNW